MHLWSGKSQRVKIRIKQEIAIPKPRLSFEDVTEIIAKEARR